LFSEEIGERKKTADREVKKSRVKAQVVAEKIPQGRWKERSMFSYLETCRRKRHRNKRRAWCER